jgi:hypothetical protein
MLAPVDSITKMPIHGSILNRSPGTSLHTCLPAAAFAALTVIALSALKPALSPWCVTFATNVLFFH